MARLVLVDGDAARRLAIEEELGRLGHDIAQAPSGAFALTMLDRSKVDLIVSAARMSDMDACELCAILRSDPHHERLAFILLGAAGGPTPWAAAQAGIDEVLPPSWTMPMLVSRVHQLLGRGREGRMAPARLVRAPRAPAPAGALEGSLGVMDLPEVAQAIAMGGKTGRLEVSLAAGDGVVVFDVGRVAHAEFGGGAGERAFSALVVAACRERGGRFRFLPAGDTPVASPRTIGKGIEQLLLGVASEIDEGIVPTGDSATLTAGRPAHEGA